MNEGMLKEGMYFDYISPFVVEETSQGKATISGTLLAEGITGNNHLYTVEEMENIAPQVEGMPIYYGTMTKLDPNTNIIKRNMHANIDDNRIGQMIKAWFDATIKRIKYIAEIFNTAKFPDIVSMVKKGWGVSIGGIATRAYTVLETLSGRILTKISGLKLNHVQLVAPSVKRGQEEAQVEDVEVQETMIMYCDPTTGKVCTGNCPTCKHIEETVPTKYYIRSINGIPI
jgi:hypothetical protein